LHCIFKEIPPTVGYAATARIRSADPPMESHSYYDRGEWWDSLLKIPPPRVVVIEDLDKSPGLGAFVGEVHANILRALGCVAFVTNGAVRDLPEVHQTGFQLFAGNVSVSHAFAHVFDFGNTVEVGHMQVRPGDLLHGDRHGIQTIPLEIAARVPQVAQAIMKRRQELIDQVWQTRTTLGNCMDPHASWVLQRGLKTLAVRVARQNENAQRVAEFLRGHAKVRSVHYPFLKTHAQYAVAREQMSGGGGMVTFEIEGNGEDARRATEAMRLFTLAPSLGGVESLVSIPVLTSHLTVPEEERRKMGISEQMIRLSVGIENAEDLIADLEGALAAVAAPNSVTVG